MPGTIVYGGRICRVSWWMVISTRTYAWIVDPDGRSAFVWYRFGDFMACA